VVPAEVLDDVEGPDFPAPIWREGVPVADKQNFHLRGGTQFAAEQYIFAENVSELEEGVRKISTLVAGFSSCNPNYF
jgi:hypothetical protein